MKGGMNIKDALKEYEKFHHVPADRHWKSVLYLATALDDGGRIFKLLDLENGEAFFEDFIETREYQILSSGERMMIDLARLLFSHNGSVSVLDAANKLDDKHWIVFMKAIEIYRGD